MNVVFDGAQSDEQCVGDLTIGVTGSEFTGEASPWVGKESAREALRRGWEQPLPDLELSVQRIEIRDGAATSAWVCRSSALPGPVRGEDHYTIADGKITRLEVRIVED